MTIPRIYCSIPLTTGKDASLDGQAARHLVRVLRVAAGDELVLFNGDGFEYPARVLSTGRDALTASVGPARDPGTEPSLPLVLCQGLARGARMDTAIQKATELGAQRILVIAARRGVVWLDDERAASRREHWQGVAASAAEQSGRVQVPAVSGPLTLAAALDALPDDALRLIAEPGTGCPLPDAPPAGGIVLLVGPEGGWDEAELELAKARGCAPLGLGPRVLRTETAPLAALAILQHRYGDMG